jgi:nucleoid DNA-binding protein
MTKAEIIRKLAKRAGVQDLDAKIFFEVFLRKVSLQLNPGETIKIKNIGYFQMRTGKIKKTSEEDSNRDHILADLIVFHPLYDEPDESEYTLIFNVPCKTEEEYNVIDSYFSLSFGKPVIPLKDANISEYFIPPTGNELRRLFDTKADKLLQEVEVVENFTKGNEILLIDPEFINPNQMEINWDERKNEPASPENNIEGTEQSSLTDTGAFSWEFGEELEKQIEEEALLDTENDDNLFVDLDELKDISWDFGENIIREEEPPLQSKIHPQDDVHKNLDKFQRVKSFTSDYNIDHNSITPVTSDKEEDSDLLKSINEELNDEGFAEIKHIPRDYKIEPPLIDKTDETPYEIPVVPEIENENNKIELDRDLIPVPLIPEVYKRGAGYSQRRGLGLYVIVALILVLAGTVYLYIKVINPFYSGSNKVADAKVTTYNTPPEIIERDFEIPVTYPYTKDSNIVHPFDPIDKNVFAQTDNPTNNDSIGTNQNDQNNPNVPVQQTAKPNANTSQTPVVKVNNFIYRSGNKYLVQISSWSSKSKALDHASYFNKKGFQTEIEMANLPRGTFYRVRVGNFNTENEAEKFYNKYK